MTPKFTAKDSNLYIDILRSENQNDHNSYIALMQLVDGKPVFKEMLAYQSDPEKAEGIAQNYGDSISIPVLPGRYID